MKRISFVQLGRPSRQWQGWLNALADAGFRISAASPMAMELQTIPVFPGDIIVLDGMLPNLSRFIERTCARCPDAQIIVVTEVDSFTVKYETMHRNRAVYISGPMTKDQFVSTVQRVVAKETAA